MPCVMDSHTVLYCTYEYEYEYSTVRTRIDGERAGSCPAIPTRFGRAETY